MKAIVCQNYGSPDVLELEEVEKPTPKNNEVLIQIHATTVTPSDVLLRSGNFPLLFLIPGRIMYGITRPRRLIPGYELAGVIESVGKDAKLFQKGDQVFGASTWKMSCNAEYICLPEKAALAIKPADMTYEAAAAFCDGACTALNFLKEGNIQRGHNVLIYGASGSVGTYAVQLAKYFGADVTGVCSAANVEMVQALGADKVIDYTAEDFTNGGETYDIIFDAVGKSSFVACMGSLKQEGTYLSTRMMLRGRWASMRSRKKAIGGITTSNAQDLTFLKGLIEAGKIKSVIDRCYPLDQIVEAHRYVEKGHKKGNVVVTVEQTPRS